MAVCHFVSSQASREQKTQPRAFRLIRRRRIYFLSNKKKECCSVLRPDRKEEERIRNQVSFVIRVPVVCVFSFRL
ncbi:unnamed protein product [Peronospora belbahrii]|uniref:Uncharacterized protein n=1 Tax=Peronospora belbahrii TaxID=622444 RepID=A0AAU9L3F5_9STRA|nr:unnamed protein product [Peronospora belbahrii]